MLNLQKARNEVKDAEKKLMPKERLNKLKSLQSEVQRYMKHQESLREDEIKEVDKRIESLKPRKQLSITEEERSSTPEMLVYGNRKLDSKNVAVMNYLSKSMMSTIAAEADTPEKLVRVVSEFADHEDINVRYAFLDSYHDILKMGQSLEGFGKVQYDLKQQYLKASDSVKTPEQLKYEDALQEAESDKLQINMKYWPEEKNVSEFINDLNIRVGFLENEINGTEQERKGVWG